jgi:esterase/lipase superfamily enzyme
MLRFALLLLILTGCAQRTEFRVLSQPGSGQTERVYVSTLRGVSDTEEFSAERLRAPRYLSLDVSVPPDRAPGEITPQRGKTLDPSKQFFFQAREDFASRAAFRSALSREMQSRPADKRYAVIFVHGYNTSFPDGVLRLSQMSHDFELGGVAMHYAWPSRASAFGYQYDRDSTLIAREGLENLIADASASGAREVILLAHSMGAFLTMEALQQMELSQRGAVRRSVNAVVLISPDIDVEVFRAQATRIGKLPDVFAVFVSKRDRALSLSAFLTGNHPRLGNISETSELSDLNVTLLDVSEFSSGIGHFTLATSPALIGLFSRAGQIEAAFRASERQNVGLLSGAIISLQGATQLVLSPLAQAVD